MSHAPTPVSAAGPAPRRPRRPGVTAPRGRPAAGGTWDEALYPDTPEFVATAQKAWRNAPQRLMGAVWRAYDALRADELARELPDAGMADLERSLTEHLYDHLNRVLGSRSAILVRYEPCERAARKRRGRPPQCDLAFVLRSNRRVMWPIEAKVLPTEGRLKDYVDTLQARMLQCVYAPYCGHGTMIGFLFRGSPDRAYAGIARRSKADLTHAPDWPDRWHKTSTHERTAAACIPAARTFTCHHLLMEVRTPTAVTALSHAAVVSGRPARTRRPTAPPSSPGGPGPSSPRAQVPRPGASRRRPPARSPSPGLAALPTPQPAT